MATKAQNINDPSHILLPHLLDVFKQSFCTVPFWTITLILNEFGVTELAVPKYILSF